MFVVNSTAVAGHATFTYSDDRFMSDLATGVKMVILFGIRRGAWVV